MGSIGKNAPDGAFVKKTDSANMAKTAFIIRCLQMGSIIIHDTSR